MSYDLAVFEPSAAPSEYEQFLSWYGAQVEWREDATYEDPNVSSLRLQAWISDIYKLYPPMNGPGSSEELPEDESSLADYSIGENLIYICFAWSKMEAAYKDVSHFAAKHGLGFFNVSSPDSEVWLPSGHSLRLAFQKPGLAPLGRLQKLLSTLRRR